MCHTASQLILPDPTPTTHLLFFCITEACILQLSSLFKILFSLTTLVAHMSNRHTLTIHNGLFGLYLLINFSLSALVIFLFMNIPSNVSYFRAPRMFYLVWLSPVYPMSVVWLPPTYPRLVFTTTCFPASNISSSFAVPVFILDILP